MSLTTRRPTGLTYEALSPAPDGVRRTFLTAGRYRPGSVAVWLNGLRLDAPSVEATDGLHVTVLGAPPRPGDTLEVQYNTA